MAKLHGQTPAPDQWCLKRLKSAGNRVKKLTVRVGYDSVFERERYQDFGLGMLSLQICSVSADVVWWEISKKVDPLIGQWFLNLQPLQKL